MRNYLITLIVATAILGTVAVKAFNALGEMVESENQKSEAAWNAAFGK